MKTSWLCAGLVCGATGIASGQNLLRDPGFDAFDAEWGTFGAAGINDFFGNPHGSLFADGAGNFGGFFQLGLAAQDDVVYTFTLTDVRIEANFNANLRFGLEFYEADDSTKIGEVLQVIDTNDPMDGLVTGDGLVFSVDVASVNGAAFVRPIVLFDNAAPSQSTQANAFVFDASLTAIPAPASALAVASLGLAARRRR